MSTETACLPYPIGINVVVYRDDGNWNKYSKWFMRPMHQVQALLVARITLAHYEGEDEPAYTHSEWVRKADKLVQQYPDCIFVY